jgi:hypothetical protein
MFGEDNSEANLGYGVYLITVKALSPNRLSALDPNVALGAFTYERYGDFASLAPRGTSENPWREIDLAEISRWGWNHIGACPYSGFNEGSKFPLDTLCKGNAQFATQLVDKAANSVQR